MPNDQRDRTVSAEVILAGHEADPATYDVPLAKKLAEAGADDDTELVAAARALMELVEQKARSPARTTCRSGSQGIRVGDGNLQINTF